MREEAQSGAIFGFRQAKGTFAITPQGVPRPVRRLVHPI